MKTLKRKYRLRSIIVFVKYLHFYYYSALGTPEMAREISKTLFIRVLLLCGGGADQSRAREIYLRHRIAPKQYKTTRTRDNRVDFYFHRNTAYIYGCLFR